MPSSAATCAISRTNWAILLFQVVFHAQIASEAHEFDFDAVAGAICDKLLRRHPHVFGAGGPMTPAEQSAAWEEIKAAGTQRGGGTAGTVIWTACRWRCRR